MRWTACVACVGMLMGACASSPERPGAPSAQLDFSDGRRSVQNLSEINEVLMTVGVRLEPVELPDAARPLLADSSKQPLTESQSAQLLEVFSLSRQDVVALARAAGREPVISGGGSMRTGEIGVAPYPKIYDLRSMGPSDRRAARDKFARLHVNSTDAGTGVDEVMTLVAGGPWTWFFLVDNAVVVQLRMSRVEPGGPGWRLIYPGLTPHGGHFHAEDGVCIAYITGPETWTMRYESPGLRNGHMLGKNPWIDFTAP